MAFHCTQDGGVGLFHLGELGVEAMTARQDSPSSRSVRWRVGAVVVGLFAVMALVAAGVALRPASAPEIVEQEHPNVLIVLWDTVRADHLSLYGHDVDTTPALKRFAEEAVVFDHAVSPGMWTVPSHGAMFTGLPPATHGATFEWRWLDHHHTTLAEYFKAHGYDTFAFSANPNLAPRGANLLQGFDTIETSWGEKWWPLVRRATMVKLLPNDASTEISPAFEGNRPGNTYYNGAVATGRALNRWLDDREPGKPWLAYLNYMEAHKPRVPLLRHRREVMDEAMHEVALKTDITFLSQMAFGYGVLEYTDLQLAATRAVYDACVRELDWFTEKLMRRLDERGMLDNTIVVLTSDHGESLGEHHRFGHRYDLHQTLLHVPLLIRYPDKLKPRRVSEPVTTQDLFATLTELAEIPAAPTATHSRSLFGEPRGSIFSEVLSFDSQGLDLVLRFYPDIEEPEGGFERTFRSIRKGSDKLILDNHEHAELYDLDDDPLETRDLAAQQPETVAKLVAEMKERWAALPAYDPEKRIEDDQPVFTLKEKSMLEVLGYVVDDEDVIDGEDSPPDDPMMDPGL
jgi:arylsulfatase A-like enzyme